MFQNALAYITASKSVTRPIAEDLISLNEVDVDSTTIITDNIYKNTPSDFWTATSEIAGTGTEDPYIISSVDEMERLSILLTTTSKYGT